MIDDPGRIGAACAVLLCYLLLCSVIVLRHRLKRKAAERLAASMLATADGHFPLLIGYASQTGFGERIAWQTAGAFRDAGVAAAVLPLGEIDQARLEQARSALFIVSTTGEGDAPDGALRFVRSVMGAALPLHDLRYGLLALGDRSYRQFCAFGHRLDSWLRHQGATPATDLVEVDNADGGALRHWQSTLRVFGADSAMPDWMHPGYQRWRLRERQLLNPGSPGGPAFHIVLQPLDGPETWQAGDIAEIGPFDPISHEGAPPPHREYSIASLPEDGAVELIVRQMRHPDGRLGLGSGWLTDRADIGGEIALRIRQNRAFHGPADDRPMILIGNGTGIAGLRAHLRARERAGHHRNWLIFGERTAAFDYFFRNEIETWKQDGVLQRLDLAFSRDQAERVYVQHKLEAAATDVRQWVGQGAAIYVCGSLEGMAGAVTETLAEIFGAEMLDDLIETGRYRRDVY